MLPRIEFETHSAATRYVEEHAVVSKLRSGVWRAWIKRMPDGREVKDYGFQRLDAIANAATKLVQLYPFKYE